MVNGRRERQQDITPGPSDYAPCRNDVMSRHRRQPVYVMSRADSAKRRQAQATVTPGTTDYTTSAGLALQPLQHESLCLRPSLCPCAGRAVPSFLFWAQQGLHINTGGASLVICELFELACLH